MTDRPIIFSAPMVQALLSGRKTQTRRLLKPQPPTNEAFSGSDFGLSRAVADGVKMYSQNDYDRLPKHPTKWDLVGSVGVARDAGFPQVYDARYAVGDRLWVREAWRDDAGSGLLYRATDPDAYGLPWRSPIHMPRWASRLTLTITDVRVQRLREISRDDVIAEGITERDGFPLTGVADGWHEPFAALWDSINGAGAWTTNPWVVALTFTVSRHNIDAPDEPPQERRHD